MGAVPWRALVVPVASFVRMCMRAAAQCDRVRRRRNSTRPGGRSHCCSPTCVTRTPRTPPTPPTPQASATTMCVKPPCPGSDQQPRARIGRGRCAFGGLGAAGAVSRAFGSARLRSARSSGGCVRMPTSSARRRGGCARSCTRPRRRRLSCRQRRHATCSVARATCSAQHAAQQAHSMQRGRRTAWAHATYRNSLQAAPSSLHGLCDEERKDRA